VGPLDPIQLSHWRPSLARLALLALLAAGALVALPSSASAAANRDRAESSLQLPGPGGPFPDSVIGPRRAGGVAPRHARAFPVLGGEQVEVSSTYYSDAEMQGVADVLGGLVHGPEMNSLSVYVASPSEIASICGPDALACYAPASGEMFVSGEDGEAYGVPRDYTIAHEYGHHIAGNRLNSPWPALETGAKRWSSYEQVCQGVRKRSLYPGNEGNHYWENPGEAFAESNAHLNYPGVAVPWGYSSLLQPSATSLAKLRADITDPWTGPTTVTWNGAMWPSRRNPAEHRFSTPYDGQVEIRLNGPAGSNYDLFVLGQRLQGKRVKRNHRKLRLRLRVVHRAATGGSEERIAMTVCGQGSIQVEVRRRSGTGPFAVTVARP
jgi:hypothetical protein